MVTNYGNQFRGFDRLFSCGHSSKCWCDDGDDVDSLNDKYHNNNNIVGNISSYLQRVALLVSIIKP